MTTTFSWTDMGGQTYQVKAGTTPGAYDLGYVNTTGLQGTLNNLPLDGSTIYVTVSTKKYGVWRGGTSHAMTASSN